MLGKQELGDPEWKNQNRKLDLYDLEQRRQDQPRGMASTWEEESFINIWKAEV